MSKEYLESLEKIKQEFNCDPEYYGLGVDFEILESALQRLEAIENAEPSVLLKFVDGLLKRYENKTDYNIYITKDWLLEIKQTLILAEKEHNSINLLMQELDCKDFAELRKYARCGYQTFRNAKGSQYRNIIIDEAQEQEISRVAKKLKLKSLKVGLMDYPVKENAKYKQLEEEIGCPLEVLVRALKDGVYVLDRETGGTKCILRGFVNSVQHFKGDVFGFVDDRFWAKIKDEETGLYIPILYAWKDYKKTWWLKENREE